MRKHRYTLRTDSVRNEAGESRSVYGIEVWAGAERVGCVKDVFLDRREAEKLVGLCNRLSLSPVHLADVIEDSIS